MAIRLNRIGTMKVTQTRYGETHTFDIGICEGDFLALFRYETDDHYFPYDYFHDEKHCANLVEQNGFLFGFGDKVSDIKLNLFYKSARRLLEVLIKYGYDVNGYTKREEE